MTREIEYAVMDPTGNITILVETPVPEGAQPLVAEQLMKLEPAAEQVGFLTWQPDLKAGQDSGPEFALRMAGGEFCGNASMSAAAYEVIRKREETARMTGGMKKAAEAGTDSGTAAASPRQWDIVLRVSGAEQPVKVRITEEGPAVRYRGTVEMPRPRRIREVQLPLGAESEEGACAAGSAGAVPVPAVEFEGITHLIIRRSGAGERIREQAETLAPVWCRALGAEALGLMFLDEEAETMTPLVYVPAAGTLVWENSCASGTTASGAWLAAQRKQKESGGGASESVVQSEGPVFCVRLRQPGGTLGIAAEGDGTLLLSGGVYLMKKGKAVLGTETEI